MPKRTEGERLTKETSIRNPMERLAREICWAPFVGAKNIGATKAGYWKSLPEDTRVSYRVEAHRLRWMIERIPESLIVEALKTGASE